MLCAAVRGKENSSRDWGKPSSLWVGFTPERGLGWKGRLSSRNYSPAIGKGLEHGVVLAPKGGLGCCRVLSRGWGKQEAEAEAPARLSRWMCCQGPAARAAHRSRLAAGGRQQPWAPGARIHPTRHWDSGWHQDPAVGTPAAPPVPNHTHGRAMADPDPAAAHLWAPLAPAATRLRSGCSYGTGMGTGMGSGVQRRRFRDCSTLSAAELDGAPGDACTASLELLLPLLHQPKVSPLRKGPEPPDTPLR